MGDGIYPPSYREKKMGRKSVLNSNLPLWGTEGSKGKNYNSSTFCALGRPRCVREKKKKFSESGY